MTVAMTADPGPRTRLDRAAVDDLETPCFVYGVDATIANFQALRERLGTPLVVSLKANPNVDLLSRAAHVLTDGVELASLGEIRLVVGRLGGPFFVSSPALTDRMVEAALAIGATILFDSLAQVARYAPVLAAAREHGPSAARAGLRLSCAALHPAGSTAADHFGMAPEDAAAAVRLLAGVGVEVGTLSAFAGSYGFRAEAADRVEALAVFARTLARDTGAAISTLGLGGGFTAGDLRGDRIARYRSAVEPAVEGFQTYHESGRAIFASAGLFVVRVLHAKALNGRTVVVCDGGLAQCFLLAQTEAPVRLLRVPTLVPKDGEDRPALAREGLVVGSTCNRDDVIGRLPPGAPLPRSGDALVFDDCGAYGATYTPTRFLQLEEAREYVLP